METFIYPQLWIGMFATYLAKSTTNNIKGYEKLTIQNLKYRYLYGAACDVLETIEMLGYVSPIFSTNNILPPLLIPVDDEESSDERKLSLVYYSSRPKCEFCSNIPALIQLILFWLSRKKTLVASISVRDSQRRPYFTRQGNLAAHDVFTDFPASAFRMRVQHKEKKVKRTIPQAILSLVTDSRQFGGFDSEESEEADDGITFQNLLADLEFETKEAISRRMKDMDKVGFEAFARRMFSPSDSDKIHNDEEDYKDEEARTGVKLRGPGYLRKSTAGSGSAASTPSLAFPSQQLVDIFGPKKAPFLDPKKVRSNLDLQIAVCCEKLVRLSLAKAAESRIDLENNEHSAFSPKYLQSEDSQKAKEEAIMNGLSQSIASVVSAMMNCTLDIAEKSNAAASSTPYEDPYKALEAVRNGEVPVHWIRSPLSQMANFLLNDKVTGTYLTSSSADERNKFAKATQKAEGEEAAAKKSIEQSIFQHESKYYRKMKNVSESVDIASAEKSDEEIKKSSPKPIADPLVVDSDDDKRNETQKAVEEKVDGNDFPDEMHVDHDEDSNEEWNVTESDPVEEMDVDDDDGKGHACSWMDFTLKKAIDTGNIDDSVSLEDFFKVLKPIVVIDPSIDLQMTLKTAMGKKLFDQRRLVKNSFTLCGDPDVLSPQKKTRPTDAASKEGLPNDDNAESAPVQKDLSTSKKKKRSFRRPGNQLTAESSATERTPSAANEGVAFTSESDDYSKEDEQPKAKKRKHTTKKR